MTSVDSSFTTPFQSTTVVSRQFTYVGTLVKRSLDGSLSLPRDVHVLGFLKTSKHHLGGDRKTFFNLSRL